MRIIPVHRLARSLIAQLYRFEKDTKSLNPRSAQVAAARVVTADPGQVQSPSWLEQGHGGRIRMLQIFRQDCNADRAFV
jgi:hypothetical protein